jgi:hypothetical protein
MSVLNNVPLQQQQINKPINSIEQQTKQQYPSTFRNRLASAENLHG